MVPQATEPAYNRDSFGIDPTRNSSSSAVNKSVSESTFNPIANTMSQKTLIQRQQEVIKQQDAMLVDISKGVDVLHNQALDINQEAKLHIKILEKLDVNVDKAAEALKAEAEHAENIRQTSRMCFLYIIILIEVVIIVFMLVFMFAL